MTNSETLEERWQRYSVAVAKVNGLNKTIVFDALAAAGITHIVIGFDGEGDSGQIDGGAAFEHERAVDFPDVKVTIVRAQSGSDEFSTHDVPLREAIEELCYGYLEQEYGGWENNDGAFGEFTFHVAERRIALEFNGRFTDYAHNSHAF